MDAVTGPATIETVGSEDSDFPATNLQLQEPTMPWKTAGLSSMYVNIDMGSALPINFAAIVATNCTSSATWRVRGATSEANLTASPGYDSGNQTVWPQTNLDTYERVSGFDVMGSDQTYRWWRIDITDGSNPDGFVQVGRLFLAQAWQPAVNLAYGWSLGFKDLSKLTRSLGSSAFTNNRRPFRVLNLTLDFQSEDDMYDNAFQFDKLRGKSKDYIFMRDPDSANHLHDQSFQGLVTNLRPIVNPRYGTYRKQYTVEEMV